jgi:hypothetical protein
MLEGFIETSHGKLAFIDIKGPGIPVVMVRANSVCKESFAPQIHPLEGVGLQAGFKASPETAYTGNAGLTNEEIGMVVWPGADIRLRDRTAVVSPSLRQIEMIPPMEIVQGLTSLIASSLGATETEAVCCRARLGFKATSSQLRDVIVARIEALKSDGELSLRDGMLVCGNGAAPTQ